MSEQILREVKMQCFAVVVDGEVAGNYCFREEDEKWVAIFSSNPTFIPIEEPIEEGLTWDGSQFK